MSQLLPEEQATMQTYDKVAGIWAEKYSVTDFWAEEMRRFHEILPKGTVLEIGAGAGLDAKELISLAYDYVGTDVSEGLLEVARANLPNQLFYQQSVYDLSFPNQQKFDGFWASKVLLHLPKARIDMALKSINSVVKLGAIGFISLIDGKGEGMELEDWDDGGKHHRYFAYYSKGEFTDILRQTGFQVADYKYRKDSDRFKWHCFFVKTVNGKNWGEL
jgi:SAM-dependent methyltransferase